MRAAVRAAWGREFRGLPAWPVEVEGIPRAMQEVLALIRAAPEPSLELIQCPDGPSGRMRALELPSDRAALLFAPAEQPFVLRVGNVAAWCPPAADWCRSFALWVTEGIGPAAGDVLDVRADLYLVAPGGVTTFHADPSHNFTLQVQGRREIHAFSNADPRLIDDLSRAGVYLHRGCYPVYRAECEDRAWRFGLAPGRSCYLPPLTGHWIQNGGELSISYVISIRTRRELREKLVHGMNARLRSIGWCPSPFGSHPARDGIKAGLEHGIRSAGRWFSRKLLHRPPQPFLDPLDL